MLTSLNSPLSKPLATLFMAFAMYSAPLAAEPVELETYRGAVSVEQKPKTIAVFDIPAVDTLNALDVPIAGTVEKLYVDYLDGVAESAKTVGNLFEPDFKALSMMNPDLIIVGGRSTDTLDAVKKVAPAIDMTIDGDDLHAQIKARTTAYGQLFGKEEQAAALLATMDEAVEKAQSAAADKGTVLVVMTNGPKISAFGPKSRFGWLYSSLGLEAAATDISIADHGDAISFEFVLKTDPDWLVVIDRSSAIGQGESAKQTLDNELMHKTKAWKNEQVIYMNSADTYIASGGIQAQTRIMKQMADAFGAAK